MSRETKRSATRPAAAALFALAFSAAPVLLPFTPALAAFAETSTPAEPLVTASTDAIGSVRVEWYTDPGVSQVEIVSRDSNGGSDARTVNAAQGFLVFTGLPAGDWSASVTALSGGSRSSAVTVWASIMGAAAPSQPSAAQPVPDAVPTAEPTAEAAAPVSLAFAVTPRDDGALQGGSARVIASGLRADEKYQVTLRSTGAVLAEGVVGADGSVDSEFTLPADAAVGDDALVFAGIGTDGLPVTGEYAVSFTAAPTEAPVDVPEAIAIVPEAAAPGGIDYLLSLKGDEAVPVLMAGAAAATATTGAAVGAASVVNGRLRRLRLHRLIDRDLAGLPALPKGGIGDTFRDVLSVLRGAR